MLNYYLIVQHTNFLRWIFYVLIKLYNNRMQPKLKCCFSQESKRINSKKNRQAWRLKAWEYIFYTLRCRVPPEISAHNNRYCDSPLNHPRTEEHLCSVIHNTEIVHHRSIGNTKNLPNIALFRYCKNSAPVHRQKTYWLTHLVIHIRILIL